MQEEINNQSMLKVGKVLRGIYRIDSYLSSGGFGNTYVATNIEFNERVAIKEFFMKGVSQRDDNQSTVSISNTANRNSFLEQKDKFKKEARRLRQLNNPHIVKVYDLFDENGTSYYVMDYIDGENLSERLKRTGKRMSQKTIKEILPQILDALKAVHEAGFWHLDLKPANIMLDKSGNVKLIDFGASKQFDVQKGGATTGTAISYTNGYAPREQMEQNYDKFGPWTDLYALGATLYKLLTNSNPPLPTDIDDDMSEDKHEALPFPATISASMKHLVLWLMNTNRMRRPQSIEEVERFMKNKPSNATEQESPATGYSNPKPTLAPNPSSDSDEGTIVASKLDENFSEEKYLIPIKYVQEIVQTVSAANNGDVDAMFALGMMYLRGQRVKQDSDTARRWFESARARGDYRAKWILNNWNALHSKYVKYKILNETNGEQEDNSTRNIFIASSIVIVAIVSIFLFRGCENRTEVGNPNDTIDNAFVDTIVSRYHELKPKENKVSIVNLSTPIGNCKYFGEAKNDEPDGYGEAWFDDGRYYKGYFVNGNLHGINAYFRYGNGDTFEGEFRNNTFYQGTYTIAKDGSYFIGTYNSKGQPLKGTWYDKNAKILEQL